MISGFQSLCVPTYHLLTPEQIKSIHTATLELLETVGVDVHHDEARQMLADATLTEIRREAETKLKDHYFTS